MPWHNRFLNSCCFVTDHLDDDEPSDEALKRHGFYEDQEARGKIQIVCLFHDALKSWDSVGQGDSRKNGRKAKAKAAGITKRCNPLRR